VLFRSPPSQKDYFSVLPYIFFFSSGSSSPFRAQASYSFPQSFFTDGRTPWTSDQPVVRPLPKHRTTQRQNRRIHTPNIHALNGLESTIPASELAKTVHALDRAATVTCSPIQLSMQILGLNWAAIGIVHLLATCLELLYTVDLHERVI
jgi:hypothetical protein